MSHRTAAVEITQGLSINRVRGWSLRVRAPIGPRLPYCRHGIGYLYVKLGLKNENIRHDTNDGLINTLASEETPGYTLIEVVPCFRIYGIRKTRKSL